MAVNFLNFCLLRVPKIRMARVRVTVSIAHQSLWPLPNQPCMLFEPRLECYSNAEAFEKRPDSEVCLVEFQPYATLRHEVLSRTRFPLLNGCPWFCDWLWRSPTGIREKPITIPLLTIPDRSILDGPGNAIPLPTRSGIRMDLVQTRKPSG